MYWPTYKHIKRWFGELENREKPGLINESDSFTFLSTHVTNLQWNDNDRCWIDTDNPTLVDDAIPPPDITMCHGITLAKK